MDLVRRIVGTEQAMRGWFIASLVLNMLIIVTGAVVRLTGSGLGCPTWPECFEGSFVPHAEAGIHGAIEFGNRLLTFVLALGALGSFVAAWLVRGRFTTLWWLTLGIGLGIPGQAVIGGITVRTQLNPWVVALHLLLSIALIVLCVWALTLARRTQRDALGAADRSLVVATFVAAMVVIWLGTVVTGAGPHAGDANAPRNGLDIHTWARFHGASSWLFTGLAIVALARLRHHPRSRRAAVAVLVTVVYQAVVGYTQYFLGLPEILVALHMLGITLVTASVAWLLFSSRAGRPQSSSGSMAMARNRMAR